jgi:hypothetical protein
MILKIVILYIFLLFVENYPHMQKYKTETKLNTYRSLICLYLSFDWTSIGWFPRYAIIREVASLSCTNWYGHPTGRH